MITHKDCGGYFEQYQIMGHHYCFMQCSKCGYRLMDGPDKKVTAKINKLMGIKVRPWIKKW